ncbi:hypothetical protein JB92DRAFT_2828165 [Gautieria morchelliformis]|nr:hypothetical protein JB92DRAFT_2828165 [Gautieria morchelliformis]
MAPQLAILALQTVSIIGSFLEIQLFWQRSVDIGLREIIAHAQKDLDCPRGHVRTQFIGMSQGPEELGQQVLHMLIVHDLGPVRWGAPGGCTAGQIFSKKPENGCKDVMELSSCARIRTQEVIIRVDMHQHVSEADVNEKIDTLDW